MSKKTKTQNSVDATENTQVAVTTDPSYALEIRNNWLDKYANAMGSLKRDTWAVAQVVYDTVNDAEFELAFNSLEEYGQEIGMNKSSISKMINAVKVRKKLVDYNIGTELAVHQVSETLPLYKASEKDGSTTPYFDFMGRLTGNETQKEIRQLCKNELNSVYGIVNTRKSIATVDETPVSKEEVNDELNTAIRDAEALSVSNKIKIEGTKGNLFITDALEKIQASIDYILTLDNAQGAIVALADIVVNYKNSL